MNAADFMDFGLWISEKDDFRLDDLETKLRTLPDDEDRKILERALKYRRRKSQGRLMRPSPEDRELLFALCKNWNSLAPTHKEAESKRRLYEYFMREEITALEAFKGAPKLQAFHEKLELLASPDESHAMILALLRVQEATKQWCEKDSHGRARLQSKWQKDKPLMSRWSREDRPAKSD